MNSQSMDMAERGYEEVKYHSRQKHALLKAYLRIWTDRVGRNRGRNAPSLGLVDLFASKGWCKNIDGPETWAGTSALLAECMSLYPTQYPTSLVLNSYNPKGGEEQEHQLQALRDTLAEYQQSSNCTIAIFSEPVEKAVQEAAAAVDLDFPTIWVLDPYRPQHLPWSVVETIAKLEGPNYERRPELFINLMTWSLQQNVDNAPHMVSEALGLDEGEWRPRLNDLRAEGKNTRQAISAIYGERLEEIYKRPIHTIEVDGVEGNVVYVLFLCTDNDAGFHMLRTEGVPKFTEWRTHTWSKRASEIKKGRRVDRKAAKSGHRQGRLFDDED